jgi:UDP:flavonoid glycosyltransferase YjiC (YdhE family)
MIPGSICVIHDGNDYYMNQCIAQAIPQVIIASREYARMYNGQAVQRNGIGRYLYEEDLTMGSLYENFRTVLADDSYYDHNQEMKEKITAYGDLTEILQYWK